jgi:hypothetical protein
MANAKFLTGAKSDIDNKIADGIIDGGGIILTSDTDEIVFINPKAEKRVIKSKTQKDYTLNGTTLGALEDGAVIKEGTSIDELLAMITQKSVPATYVAPTITLSRVSGSATGSQEVGTNISVALKSSFTQNEAGALTAHDILKNDVVVFEGDATNPLEHTVDSFALGEETVTFKSQASYEAGVVKNDNLGNPSPDNAIAAGSIKSSGISFTGQRAYFYGTGVGELPELNSANIRALNNKKLNAKANTVFEIPVAIGQQYVIFAYPSTLREVNQVMYVETNDTGMAPNFDHTLVEVEGANGFTAAEYRVYTYRMGVPAAASMTFKVTI